MEYLTWISLAQIGDVPLPASVWQVVAQSGFNAILILILLYYGRQELAEMRRSAEQVRLANEKNLMELRQAQDRNTKMSTMALLQVASLVPGSRQFLDTLKTELEKVEHNDEKT